MKSHPLISLYHRIPPRNRGTMYRSLMKRVPSKVRRPEVQSMHLHMHLCSPVDTSSSPSSFTSCPPPPPPPSAPLATYGGRILEEAPHPSQPRDGTKRSMRMLTRGGTAERTGSSFDRVFRVLKGPLPENRQATKPCTLNPETPKTINS